MRGAIDVAGAFFAVNDATGNAETDITTTARYANINAIGQAVPTVFVFAF